MYMNASIWHSCCVLSGMPSEEYVYAKDLIDVLKKKYDANAYESMVMLLELLVFVLSYKLLVTA